MINTAVMRSLGALPPEVVGDLHDLGNLVISRDPVTGLVDQLDLASGDTISVTRDGVTGIVQTTNRTAASTGGVIRHGYTVFNDRITSISTAEVI